MPGEDEDSFPVLSDRHNIVVIADEAHRTQYGFEARLRIIKPFVGRVSDSVTRQQADEVSGYATLTRPTHDVAAANDAQALLAAEPTSTVGRPRPLLAVYSFRALRSALAMPM